MNVLTRLFFKIAPGIRWPLRSGRMLIIRLDGIGDYILFRNFLPTLSGQRVTLLGNISFREIAETYDRNYVSEFIWVDPQKLTSAGFLLKLIVKLKLRGFDTAINPTYTSPVHKNLLLFSGSKRMISASDIRSADQFEFYKNRAFIETITGKKDHTLLTLPFNKSRYGKNIVVFPGAGDPSRQWSPASFASVINRIKKPNTNFIIAGGDEDKPLASKITSLVSGPIIDLTGKTTLIELIDLIGTCELLISNETSAIHIAAATGARAICISNGNHFHRFNPYPSELSDKIITLYPVDKFYSKDETEINDLIEECKVRSEYDINQVTVERVVEAVQKEIP